VVEKLLINSIGQVTAEDIISGYTLPMSVIAMLDGYAVCSESIANASRDNPVTLRIIETLNAGYIPKWPVKPGTAVRIMTGSITPRGVDCVVRFEDTDEPRDKSGPNPANPSEVNVFISEQPGTNIRPAGSMVKKAP
jgi:molybdopterin molybdotransferase